MLIAGNSITHSGNTQSACRRSDQIAAKRRGCSASWKSAEVTLLRVICPSQRLRFGCNTRALYLLANLGEPSPPLTLASPGELRYARVLRRRRVQRLSRLGIERAPQIPASDGPIGLPALPALGKLFGAG